MRINRPDTDLEHEFWLEATIIAKEQGKTLGQLIDDIEAQSGPGISAAGAVRVYILGYLKAKLQAGGTPLAGPRV